MTKTLRPLGLLALLLLNGCALTSKASVNFPRYFSPALPLGQSKEGVKRSGVELRLGRVSAGAHIREKIIFRDSSYEVGFYDDRLWTEQPAEYLRRALSQVLFEEEGLRSIISGAAPVLDVELISFEEIRSPKHLATVRITFTLRDDHAVLLGQTLAIERPIPEALAPRQPDVVAEALGDALRSAVYEVTGRVLKSLSVVPAASAPASPLHPVKNPR